MPLLKSSDVRRQTSDKTYNQAPGGFTLVELMVVIAIVAILATVGFVIYANVQRSARDSKRYSDMNQIKQALEQYYVVNKTYPVSPSGGASDPISAVTNLNSYFIDGKPPADPKFTTVGTPDNRYRYYSCTSPDKYIICATLEQPRGNRSVRPSDACTDPVVDSGNVHYCMGASN